jgi:hypothetical protein
VAALCIVYTLPNSLPFLGCVRLNHQLQLLSIYFVMFGVVLAKSCVHYFNAVLHMKFYVVFKSRKTGVYDTWMECESQVSGYSRNLHKSYGNRQEAEEALAWFKAPCTTTIFFPRQAKFLNRGGFCNRLRSKVMVHVTFSKDIHCPQR